MARFINHCCEPNAYARVISASYDQAVLETHINTNPDYAERHIIIMAARDIQVSRII